MKKLLSSIALAISLPLAAQDTPKNIIMVVSDGMGPVYTTAYRYYADDPKTPEIESTIFDKYYIGSSSTFPAKVSGLVTDSAASATALASGVKSYNGAIGVDVNKQPVKSVLHKAKSLGYKTGLVVTSQINHATPASYMVHNESRHNYDQIADGFYQEKTNGKFNADLMLGGGWTYFIRDDRNLVEEFKSSGFHYLDSFEQLASLPKDKPVLGLFDKKGLANAIDHDDKHRLATMTDAALKHLSDDSGMFLLVEASQVDWGGHSNDIAWSMAEMDDLAKTMAILETYVAQNPDTLVILTADHSTGGVSIGANGKYAWEPTWLKNMTASSDKIAEDIANEGIDATRITTQLGFNIESEEIDTLTTAVDNAKADWLENKDKYQARGYTENSTVKRGVYKAVNKILDKRSNTGWTTSGHTGVDVPVYAFGKQSELFKGNIDNTDIAKKIFSLIK